MKRVLLDEDIPHKLRRHLPGSATVAYMAWSGLKNGELLKAAETAGFEVLVTGDQAMTREQNMSGRKLGVVVLSAIEWPIIERHLAKIAVAIETVGAGSITKVDCGAFVRRRLKREGPGP